MAKTTIVLIAAASAVVAIAGGLYVYRHYTVTTVAMPASQPALPPTINDQKRLNVDHGDFVNRFQPKPPPPNGGRGS